MSDKLTLSPAEIVEITGKVQPAAQIRHLRRMGIRCERRADPDEPVCVLRVWLAERRQPAAESRPTLKSERREQATHA